MSTILKSWWVKLLIIFVLISATFQPALDWLLDRMDKREPSKLAFNEYCADCHATQLTGTASGSNLLAQTLSYGNSLKAIEKSIEANFQAHTSGDWQSELSPPMKRALALYIEEQRQQFPTAGESYLTYFDLGNATVEISTDDYNIEIQQVTELASAPYSIAPLPDGRMLISEKSRGLSIINLDGKQQPLIENTPKVWSPLLSSKGRTLAVGTMLDVQLHPNYNENGWIYLTFAERCTLSCLSLAPQSMVKLVRGRLEGNKWVDEQLIWSVDHKYYTVVPDSVAAGRIAFDNQGYVYISIGGKSAYKNLHVLDTPYGKVHRVQEDGAIPEDNPFWSPRGEQNNAESTKNTVYSYGHRTIQGLTSHPVTGEIWGAEMGPRGGDEINLIQSGGNYGWPLFTNGLDYDGTPITIGEDLDLDFSIGDTVLPAYDFTPAPAITNVVFYDGPLFTHWKNDLLVGSLKAQTLYRLRLKDGEETKVEKIVVGIGRIRDIEVAIDGSIYVVVEHGDHGSLYRITPIN